ncbi:MAG: type II secretion system F family protein [Bacteroidales bacterium]|nr:type II secretion system F family protein [Bacteroidales bacterium]
MVKSALSYPVIILCIAIVVLIFMLLVVVPMFEQVYARMGGSLPAVTQWIIVFAESVPRFLVILCIAGALIYMIRVRYGKTDSYRSVVSGLWMRLPLAGGLVRKYQVARFSRILYLLVSSDVPILHSLHLMQGIVSFYPYRKSLDSVCMDVEKGCSLTDGLSRFEFLYGKRFIILIRVSEETNSLGEALRTQADELDRELKYDIGQMNNILEPVLIMVIGVVVAFVLIAMYMPMFKLGMTIN